MLEHRAEYIYFGVTTFSSVPTLAPSAIPILVAKVRSDSRNADDDYVTRVIADGRSGSFVPTGPVLLYSRRVLVQILAALGGIALMLGAVIAIWFAIGWLVMVLRRAWPLRGRRPR